MVITKAGVDSFHFVQTLSYYNGRRRDNFTTTVVTEKLIVGRQGTD